MNKKCMNIIVVLAIIVLIMSYYSNYNYAYGAEVDSSLKTIIEEKENKVIGYYGAWSAYFGFSPDKLDANKLTHINYAFANIGKDLKIALGYPDIDPSNFKMLNELKQTNPDLKTLISIGGWTWSGLFSDVASTEEYRIVFADSCVDFIIQYGFDGVDLDWEYPVGGGLSTNKSRSEDKQNFTLLLKKIREKLDIRGVIDNKHYLLTIAGGAGNYYVNNTEIGKLHQYLDYVNIMTYDIHGLWDTFTDFNSPLHNNNDNSPQYKWSVDSSVDAWLNAGLPKDKLVIGIPFYGYIYNGVKNDNNGLYQKFSEAKAINFNSITTNYLNTLGYTRYYDTYSKVPWLFNGSTFITYDDAQSISIKAEYIKSNGLGGAMIWELSHDSNMVLLNAISGILNPVKVNSVENHWSKEIVNDMASMFIIKNPDTFSPEGHITRGEFAEYITRALVINKKTVMVQEQFSDVTSENELAEAINLAVEYDIITGYPDGTFRPYNQISRQEAMVMYARAMDVAELSVINNDRIESYNDKEKVADWAYPQVKKVLSAGIFNGTSDTTISPQIAFKYAEAATAIRNLLIESKTINK